MISAIVANGGYGTKTSSNVGYIAVAESWGFFIGPTFNRMKYASTPDINQREINFLEFQVNDNNTPVQPFNGTVSAGWIPWGIHHDLIDLGEPTITSINDLVDGYSINGIFKGFHSGSTSVIALRNAILANNNNNQQMQVNNLVGSYGW